MSAPDGGYANRRYNLERADAALSLARAHLAEVERFLSPSLTLSVVSMAVSDIESAEGRVQAIRERLEEEARAS